MYILLRFIYIFNCRFSEAGAKHARSRIITTQQALKAFSHMFLMLCEKEMWPDHFMLWEALRIRCDALPSACRTNLTGSLRRKFSFPGSEYRAIVPH